MKYKFSIVMAVYNVEPFIREAIDSVIAQDIGFQHVQLILVDDGSKDGSGAICDEYAAVYPDNVLALHKENGGSSSARNYGLDYVQGEYVNFMDPDDKLSPDTLRKVSRFFANHSDEVDLVSIPLIFFDGQIGAHVLNDKYKKGTRVIDLEQEWETVQLSSASSFVKASVIRRYRFDARLSFAEDAKVNQRILAEKQKLGVVSDCTYFYRKRSVGEASLVQTGKSTAKWYLPYQRYFQQETVAFFLEKYGRVPRSVQYSLMYDQQWRWLQSEFVPGVLTEEETAQYKTELVGMLQYFDDEVIMAQKNISNDLKHHLLYLKRGLIDISDSYRVVIHYIKVTKDSLEIEGLQTFSTHVTEEPQVILYCNDCAHTAQSLAYHVDLQSLGESYARRRAFRCRITLTSEKMVVSLGLRVEDREKSLDRIFFHLRAPLTHKTRNSYYFCDGMLLRPQINGFSVEKSGLAKAAGMEMKLLTELLFSSDIVAKKAFFCRLLSHMLRPFMPKNIWLISDKADRADDNGEAFFLYCTRQNKKLCRPVFAVGKNTPDFWELKKYGPVVPYLSWRYKILHLLAEHTVSAYSHDEITSPFDNYSHYYGDLLQRNKVVFLQHGIIKDDLSASTNKYHKNYSMFVTSTEREWRSVKEGNYGYDDGQVVLTGLPRYDRLYNYTQKIITIMPTWRRKLFGYFDPKISRWSLLPGFECSEFYRFYSELLTNEELLACAKRMGYTIQLLMHPVLFPYLDRFPAFADVKVLGPDTNYRDVFAESALILTDYSSVAFDFAYLRKPVLYAQFDENHYEKGYFDYRRDGFGEVECDLEGTVARIIEYMENGCQLKDKYGQRIDSFFSFHDQDNCKRVFDKIKELSTK